MDRNEAGALRLVMDTVLALGDMSDIYVVAGAMYADRYALLFCERTEEGLVPLAEIEPVRDGEYRDLEVSERLGTAVFGDRELPVDFANRGAPKYVALYRDRVAPIGDTVTPDGLDWYRQLAFDGEYVKTFELAGYEDNKLIYVELGGHEREE